ncbi:Dimethylaniline monooxygenase like protein [Argiope bruennichi]|uniref:Flavin-containing monooxygenase n=1 Tax=Argiope bruennichi TaxID=94029 RepID=A0A8T0ETH7_ARGBR|nr:Dimethylaniline monooxygenase like protein [Argiope bruennichi]
MRRRNVFLLKFLPYDFQCRFLESRVKFDHDTYNLKPDHRILSAHTTMNDTLPNCVLSGKVIVKGDIEKFEENGVVFAGEEQVTKVDSVVLATGYDIKFPFLDSSVISFENNRVHLYKYIIPTHLEHPTLAFIGLIQPLGPFFSVVDIQCRWFAQILAGNLKLPSEEEMKKDIENKIRANEKRFVNTSRHTIEADWVPYLDELAEMIGAKPNLLKLAITDPKFFWICFNGPCFPYQYRLQGPHSGLGPKKQF